MSKQEEGRGHASIDDSVESYPAKGIENLIAASSESNIERKNLRTNSKTTKSRKPKMANKTIV